MEQLRKDLEIYQSSFSVNKNIPDRNGIRLLEEKLKLEMKAENEYDTDMEKCRTWNLLSFCHFILGETDNAEYYNEKVLNLDRRNIIALSNKAQFCLQKHGFTQCKALIKELKQLKEDAIANLIAKAEVAFTVSRLGMRQYSKAKQLFSEVMKDCNDIMDSDTAPQSIPNEYRCIWMYGFALVQRRMINFDNIIENNITLITEMVSELKNLFEQIIHLKSDNNCVKRFKARSYVELGKLVYTTQTKELIKHQVEFPLRSFECFYKALEIFPDDVYVLERCGAQFRYMDDLAGSIQLLEKAVKLKGSSYGYHHLALSLRRKLDIDVGNFKGRRVSWLNIKPYSDRRQKNQTPSCFQPSSVNSHKTTTSTYSLAEDHASLAFSVHQPTKRQDIRKKTRAPLHKNNPRTNAHYREPEEKEHTASAACSIRHSTTLSGVIKNPWKLKKIEYGKNKDSVDRIIECFDKACEISMNPSARHDEGLFYRQLGNTEKALEIFRSLMQNSDCSRVELAKAYEQAAFCLQDCLQKEVNVNETIATEMEEQIKMYLQSSLEIQCNMVAKIPDLQKCWKSAPTLKKLLSGTASTKEKKKELLSLYQKMNDYGGAIKILEELENISESNEEIAEILKQKVETLVDSRRFDDAAIALNVVTCLPDGKQMIGEELFQQVYIESGFESLKRGPCELARQRIRNAFDAGHINEEISVENDLPYDIFILCNLNDDDNGMKLMKLLQSFQLKTTFNIESRPAGTIIASGMKDLMEQSKRFVILCDFIDDTNKANQSEMEYYASLIIQYVQKKNIVTIPLIMMDAQSKIPELVSHLPYERIDMEFDQRHDALFFSNESNLNALKKLFFCLLKTK